MSPIIDAWSIVVLALAAMLNCEQAKSIDYLRTQNRVLEQQLKSRGGWIRFADKQRCLLAVKAKALGRKALRELDTIVTPDTLLRWHRQLIAEKYDGSGKRSRGRPRIMKEIEALIVRMATQNKWGYLRITGARRNLGHTVARRTIANVLARHGIEPAPERRSTWRRRVTGRSPELSTTESE